MSACGKQHWNYHVHTQSSGKTQHASLCMCVLYSTVSLGLITQTPSLKRSVYSQEAKVYTDVVLRHEVATIMSL